MKSSAKPLKEGAMKMVRLFYPIPAEALDKLVGNTHRQVCKADRKN